MAGKNILIAEDDPVLRDVYVRKFSNENFSIRTAENGEQALKMLQENEPDVLLLDINMPLLDGYGVLDRFPKEKRSCKVIILTNFEDQENRRKAEKHGVDGYFVKKNMTIKSLYEMVQAALGVVEEKE